jgi:hypothetical protein
VRKPAEKVVEAQNEIITVLEDLFPKLENDISLRSLVEKLPQLTANPDPAAVAQLFVEVEEIFTRMSPGSLSDQEKFILLIKKLHPKTFGELRGDRYYKHRTETYQSLKEALLEKAKEDWLERQLFAQKKQVLQTLDAQPNAMQVDTEPQIFQRTSPEIGKGKGKGKGKGGKGKGKRRGDFHSSRPGFQGNPKDPNWQTSNAQAIVPRFSATIYCKFCRKKGHYEDACWSKAKYEKKKKNQEVGNQAPLAQSSSSPAVDNSKKRKVDALHLLSGKSWFCPAMMNGMEIQAVIDSGATLSAVSSACIPANALRSTNVVPIQVGSGETIYSSDSRRK